MAREQIKVDLKNLIKGMYVTSLDRPWAQTPFPIQGFYIDGHETINTLKQHCKYVYIDVLRGKSPVNVQLQTIDKAQPVLPDSTVHQTAKKSELRTKSPAVARIKIKHDVYPEIKSLKKEIKVAAEIHRMTSLAMSHIMSMVRSGKQLNIPQTQQIVDVMVNSIIRNPDAFVWLSKIKEKDDYLYGHSVRSSILSVVFGRYIGLSKKALDNLALGLLLSEIGKAKIPLELLRKTGPLNTFEQAIMDRHVEYSMEILQQTPDIDEQVIAIVATKNERHNGSGYPNHLSGDQIPLLGKMAGLVDTYDLLTNARNPQDSINTASAIEKIYDMRNIEFQGQLIDEFIQAVGIFPAGTLVELNTNEVGVIVEQNRNHRLRAKVMLVLDKNKNMLDKFKVIDLSKHRKTKGQEGSTEIRKSVAAGVYDIDHKVIYEKGFTKKWGIIGMSLAN